jgi:hypothetical protein
MSLYCAALIADPNELKLSSSAMFEYKLGGHSSPSDVNEMYANAIELLQGVTEKPLSSTCIEILEEFIQDKVHFATMPDKNNPGHEKYISVNP